jgi:hypothetical protein
MAIHNQKDTPKKLTRSKSSQNTLPLHSFRHKEAKRLFSEKTATHIRATLEKRVSRGFLRLFKIFSDKKRQKKTRENPVSKPEPRTGHKTQPTKTMEGDRTSGTPFTDPQNRGFTSLHNRFP